MKFADGAIWYLTIGQYSGTERLNAEDLGKSEDDIPEIFRLGRKYLIPESERRVLAVRSAITSMMDSVGTPFVIRGCWFVPNKNLIAADNLYKAISERQNERVEDFIERLPMIKVKRIQQYPVLAEAEWPSPEEIRRKFYIRRMVFKIDDLDLTETDPEELIEAKKEFQEELRRSYQELKNQILKKAHLAIIEVCDEIAKKILDTGDSITKTTLKKPLRVLAEYEKVAELLDSQQIKDKVQEVKQTMEGVTAKDLKESWATAESFAQAMRTIGDDLGDLTGINIKGEMKRKVVY